MLTPLAGDLTRLERKAAALAARLTSAVSGPSGGTAGIHSPAVGVTVGSALFPRDAADAEGLLRHADAAMDRRKPSRAAA